MLIRDGCLFFFFHPLSSLSLFLDRKSTPFDHNFAMGRRLIRAATLRNLDKLFSRSMRRRTVLFRRSLVIVSRSRVNFAPLSKVDVFFIFNMANGRSVNFYGYGSGIWSAHAPAPLPLCKQFDVRNYSVI